MTGLFLLVLVFCLQGQYQPYMLELGNCCLPKPGPAAGPAVWGKVVVWRVVAAWLKVATGGTIW